MGQLTVVLRQVVDGVVKNVRGHILLLCGIKLEFRQGEGEPFAFSFAERKNDDWIVVLQHDHFDNFRDVGWT